MDHDHDNTNTNNGEHPLNNDNNNSSQPNDADNNNESNVQAEAFIWTGSGGPAFLTVMHNILHTLVRGQPIPRTPQAEQQRQPQGENSSQAASQEQQAQSQLQPSAQPQPQPEDIEMRSVDDDEEYDDPPIPAIHDDPPPPAIPTPAPPPAAGPVPAIPNATQGSRPIRPLPRPQGHIHAHTPAGIIDLFTFNITGFPMGNNTQPGQPGAQGPLPPGTPPPTEGHNQGQGAATFTFNIGPDMLAGFENFFLNQTKEREPDFQRAKTLLRAMEIVPDGLVRRLEKAGGVPGAANGGKDEEGKGEEHAGCAVCWGPLLEDIEPGEWDNARQKEEREEKKRKEAEGDAMEENSEEEFRGKIVALPCAHVYHADCLLPWFARNTTCPTCRFDIDPESLTWNPQPPPPPPPEPAEPAPDANATQEGGQDPTFDQFRRSNTAEAQRFDHFIEGILRNVMSNMPPPPPFPQQQQQDAQVPLRPHPAAPENATANAPEAPQAESNNPPPPVEPQQPPQPQQPRMFFGPAPPPPPPQPVHAIPPIYRFPVGGLFGFGAAGVPLQAQQPRPAQPQEPQAQPQPQGQPQPGLQLPPLPIIMPEAYIQIPIPIAFPGHMVQPQPPQAQAQQQLQPPQQTPTQPDQPQAPRGPPPAFPFTLPPWMHRPPTSTSADPNPRPRRKWTPPSPIGKTLRERVEAKERELGLRCDDPICGLAPSDDDEEGGGDDGEMKPNLKRIQLHAAYDSHGRACEHRFHPACLVTSARVSGSRESMPTVVPEPGEDDEDDEDEGEVGDEVEEKGEVEDALKGRELRDGHKGKEVLVPCPVCRAEGWMWKEEWEEGVRAAEEELMRW